MADAALASFSSTTFASTASVFCWTALFSVSVMGVPGVGARSSRICSAWPFGSRASSRMPSLPFRYDSMVFSSPVSPTPQSSVMPTSCAATDPSG